MATTISQMFTSGCRRGSSAGCSLRLRLRYCPTMTLSWKWDRRCALSQVNPRPKHSGAFHNWLHPVFAPRPPASLTSWACGG